MKHLVLCRTIWITATMSVLALSGCTGDPSAPDIGSYRRRHEQRMARGREQLSEERRAADAAAGEGRQLSEERQRLLKSLDGLQNELTLARAKAAKLGAERTRLQEEARRLQQEADALADDARRDKSRMSALEQRKQKLSDDVSRLSGDIANLERIEGSR